jgi:predicted DNA-binding protein (MmcQ/YjbR family)
VIPPELRKICLALPGVEESTMHGHPVFRIKDKSFCIWHGADGDPAIALKVAKTEQGMFLEDARFFKTPYIGQHGWISLKAHGRLNWKEVGELVKGSYRIAAPRVKTKHVQ